MTAVLITTSSFDQAGAGTADRLRQEGLTVHENPFGRALTEAEVSALIAEHRPVALIAGTEPLTAAVLTRANAHLKVVARCGTGLENVDLQAADALGIVVSNTPDAPTQAVAELTVGLMLNLIRGITDSDRLLKSGAWKKSMGCLLGELTVGMLGLGRIGKRVAVLVSHFGARCIATDRTPDQDWAAVHHVQLVSVEELLRQADLITVHVSAGRDHDARCLIGPDEIARMKSGSFLINTARGGLIDERAVAEALTSGQLGGVALDTFEQEPYTGPLQHAPHVMLTPHIGSYARAARTQMEREAVEHVLAGLKQCASKP